MILLVEAAKPSKKYKCPYCETRLPRQDLIYHVSEKHEELIPENFTATRVVFNSINHKEHGTCTECGGITKWDEEKARYDRICERPECHASYLKKVNERNMKKYGTTNLIKDPRFAEEQQKKMLANRRISGKYKWSDGAIKTYTGSYEKKCLEFMDKVLHCKSEDVLSPGITLYYKFHGETKMYISDIYYQPYNLVIEIKDGGDNPNTRDMKEYREKQLAKEKEIIDSNEYNYIRLTNNNFAQLLEIFSLLKFQLLENPKVEDKIIKINETMMGAISGAMPLNGMSDVYVTNFNKKNDFTNEDEMNLGITRDFERFLTIGKDGELTPISIKDINIETAKFYKVKNKNALQEYYNIFRNVDKVTSIHEIYNKIVGHPLLMENQIGLDPSLEQVYLNASTFISNIVEASFSSTSLSYLSEYGFITQNICVMIDENGYYLYNTSTDLRSPSFDYYDEETLDIYKNILEV